MFPSTGDDTVTEQVEAQLEQVAELAPVTDTWVVRFVVLGLIAVVLTVVSLAGYLAAMDKSLPGEVIVIGSTAGGGLVGVLAATSSRKQ